MRDTNTKGRRGRPRSLTAADEANIRDLLVRKVPMSRIAENLHVHPKTLSRYVRDRGLRPEKLDGAAIADGYTAGGETYARMAVRLNTSPSTIGRKVRKCGRPAKRGRPGASDPRRGRGKRRRFWRGEDYDHDSLGRRGRAAWPEWFSSMTEEQRAHAEAVLANPADEPSPADYPRVLDRYGVATGEPKDIVALERHLACEECSRIEDAIRETHGDELAAPASEEPAAWDAEDSDAGMGRAGASPAGRPEARC